MRELASVKETREVWLCRGERRFLRFRGWGPVAEYVLIMEDGIWGADVLGRLQFQGL